MDYREGLHKDIGKVEPSGSELYVMPMWTEDYCRYIVERVESQHQFRHGQGYQGLGENKKIKTTDVRLSELPEVQQGYLQTYNGLLRHIDQSSVVSMTIKLNNEFTGGALHFVRQNLVNTEVPVGHICFFPSGCTHIHEVLPLKSGKRYAITFWTKPHQPS